MGLFTPKPNHETDKKQALAALRSAVQRVAVVLGPSNASEWTAHYHNLLEEYGPFRLVAGELHATYKESL